MRVSTVLATMRFMPPDGAAPRIAGRETLRWGREKPERVTAPGASLWGLKGRGRVPLPVNHTAPSSRGADPGRKAGVPPIGLDRPQGYSGLLGNGLLCWHLLFPGDSLPGGNHRVYRATTALVVDPSGPG